MTDQLEFTLGARRAPCARDAFIHRVTIDQLRGYAERLAGEAFAIAGGNGGRLPGALWQACVTVDRLADHIEDGDHLVPTSEQECIAIMAAT